MDAILRFFEELSFDDCHYWAVYQDDQVQWQVHWQRQKKPTYWQFVSAQDQSTYSLATSEVATFLAEQEIDQDNFRDSLIESILTMTCFAHTFQMQARALLGGDAVDDAVERFAEFSTALLQSAQNYIQTHRPELKVMPK